MAGEGFAMRGLRPKSTVRILREIVMRRVSSQRKGRGALPRNPARYNYSSDAYADDAVISTFGASGGPGCFISGFAETLLTAFGKHTI